MVMIISSSNRVYEIVFVKVFVCIVMKFGFFSGGRGFLVLFFSFD